MLFIFRGIVCINLQVLPPSMQLPMLGFGDVLKLLLCIKTLLGTFSIVFGAPQANFLTFTRNLCGN